MVNVNYKDTGTNFITLILLLLKLNRYQILNLNRDLPTEYWLKINREAKTGSKPSTQPREQVINSQFQRISFSLFILIFSHILRKYGTTTDFSVKTTIGFSIETEDSHKN